MIPVKVKKKATEDQRKTQADIKRADRISGKFSDRIRGDSGIVSACDKYRDFGYENPV